MAYKIEYRKPGAFNEMWNVKCYVGSVIEVIEEARKLRAQGFEVRCLNSLGNNIVGA